MDIVNKSKMPLEQNIHPYYYQHIFRKIFLHNKNKKLCFVHLQNQNRMKILH